MIVRVDKTVFVRIDDISAFESRQLEDVDGVFERGTIWVKGRSEPIDLFADEWSALKEFLDMTRITISAKKAETV